MPTITAMCGRFVTTSPAAQVAAWLQGEPTSGALWRAGLPKTFQPAPVAHPYIDR